MLVDEHTGKLTPQDVTRALPIAPKHSDLNLSDFFTAGPSGSVVWSDDTCYKCGGQIVNEAPTPVLAIGDSWLSYVLCCTKWTCSVCGYQG